MVLDALLKIEQQTRPVAVASNEGDDSRVSRKAGRKTSSRSNRGSDSSTRRRRSSDEKSEARRHHSV